MPTLKLLKVFIVQFVKYATQVVTKGEKYVSFQNKRVENPVFKDEDCHDI